MYEPTNHERSLTAALRALAGETAREGASADVEARLLAEVRLLGRARRRTLVKLYAVAAVLIVSVTVPVWQLLERPSARARADGADPPSSGPPGDGAAEFYPLTFSTVPVTGGQLIRMEVPRVTLASFGVPPADSLDGSRPGTVLADVLVGEDGLARAVRFVRPALAAAPQE